MICFLVKFMVLVHVVSSTAELYQASLVMSQYIYVLLLALYELMVSGAVSSHGVSAIGLYRLGRMEDLIFRNHTLLWMDLMGTRLEVILSVIVDRWV